MALSSDERRRRVRRAIKAGKQYDAARKYRNTWEDEAHDVETQYRTPRSRQESYGTGSYTGYASGNRAGSRRTAGRSDGAGRRRQRGRRGSLGRRIFPFLLLLLLCVLLGFGVRAAWRHFGQGGSLPQPEAATPSDAQESGVPEGEAESRLNGTGGEPLGTDGTGTAPEASAASPLSGRLAEAAHLAAQYDYDAALALLYEEDSVASDPEVQAAAASYEEAKAGLVRQDISQITHVFFHSLVVDPENAFDKSRWGKQADGYNKVMTTISEFEKMLAQFYSDGFVLVRLHDIASMQQQEDGSMKMTAGDIMLPPGKKAMVMSQDDVCYYEYMTGAGFADRIIVGEDGRPTCHYTDKDGAEFVGEYDLVPILDRFVDEHPDFSYRGARACLAFTGYNGILGYRTDETYDPDSSMYDPEKTPNPNIEEDRETARTVLAALKEEGYEFASHSWGHRNLGTVTMEKMKTDTDRWDRNVNQALMDGACDIILYPFGADVGDWHPYSHDNERFQYLWDKGFRYFCNVDSTQYWVQKGDDWLRQGRRNLDGDAMWQDIGEGKNRLSDLFPDVSAIFDKARPTPVPH